MAEIICPTCHQPQRWELTWCRRCLAAIDCACCECETLADPAEPVDKDEEPCHRTPRALLTLGTHVQVRLLLDAVEVHA